ncbi:MAG: nickel-dependent lactate racemase [Ignavibacteriales bacterium]|nr:nickel-dependent lactate racemase [Ignavibacteriales bacterium]
MKARLAYGKSGIDLDLPGLEADIIMPSHQPGVPDERASILKALDHPLGSAPLHEWLKPNCSICITFTDLTRPTPNERIIPVLLDYVHNHGVRKDQITLLNQLGTHRPNTPAELAQMLTPAIASQYRIINHEPENPKAHVQFGVTKSGAPALINRHFVGAHVRIVTGFIEPHLFAGFSGGPKCIMPGIAALQTVMSNHGYRHISDPHSTFGITDGNPIWEEMRDIALRTGKSFLLNVSLNNDREITSVFAGDLLESHRAGCEFVRQSAMQRVDEPYDIVITTNSGYPLDLNLYQTAKGMGAAARIVKEGGTIIVASECGEGVPSNSAFERLLHAAKGPDELLDQLGRAAGPTPDQWQAQIQALCQMRSRVLLKSSMPDEVVRKAHLTPCHDIAAEVQSVVAQQGGHSRIAVLPYGPLTIPYLAQEEFA